MSTDEPLAIMHPLLWFIGGKTLCGFGGYWVRTAFHVRMEGTFNPHKTRPSLSELLGESFGWAYDVTEILVVSCWFFDLDGLALVTSLGGARSLQEFNKKDKGETGIGSRTDRFRCAVAREFGSGFGGIGKDREACLLVCPHFKGEFYGSKNRD